jgi:hypothetical protein
MNCVVFKTLLGVLCLPSLEFYDYECYCGVINEARDRVVTATLGAWPEDLLIRKIW